MADKLCICVAGWHFRCDMLDALAQIQSAFDADVYVVSHRPRHEVPAAVTDTVGSANVLTRPNVGYDWGCYQQFLETGLWQRYTHVFFMHDDVVIRGIGFVPACLELLQAGWQFVGNGRNADKVDWPKTHVHCYAHAAVRPPGPDFRHATVRGSFLAMSRDTLAELGALEVFWDPFHLSDRFGNWSLVASCGRMAVRFGQDCLAFLSDTSRQSEYLVELVRGEPDLDVPSADLARGRWLPVAMQVVLARKFMRLDWSPGGGRMRSLAMASLRAALSLNATRRLTGGPAARGPTAGGPTASAPADS